MSNPIRSLLPTPLSMNFISDINALNQLPLPMFKFLIGTFFVIEDSALSIANNFNVSDQSFLKKILHRQNISPSLIFASLNALKSIHSIIVKVLKLMRTSQPDEIQANLENCQKYLATVLSQNTLLQQIKITYFIETLSQVVQKSLESTPKTVETNLGTIEWSIYNIKKTNLNKSQQNTLQNNNESQQSSITVKTVNKMYGTVSFGDNFSPSQAQKYISSGMSSNLDMIIEANSQETWNKNGKNDRRNSCRTVVMSLIDFRLFFQEVEKLKNLNY